MTVKAKLPPFEALYPLPVVLLTCRDEEGKSNIITLAWVGVVSSDPPHLSVSVQPSRHSYAILEKAGYFVVNVPTVSILEKVDQAGCVSGRDVDKWAKCGFTPAPASKIRTPIISECPVALECRVLQSIEVGTHTLFVGEVLAVQIDEQVLDSKGHIDYQKAQPLGFAGGQYLQMHQVVGQFGDWRRLKD